MHWFASDVHWQPDGPTGAFGDFLERLGARARREPVSLYILGDLFDFWWERGERTLPAYDRHVAALRAVVVAGVRVTLLFGNRDFTLGRALPAACGVEVAGDRSEVEVGGRRISLQHGDLLCTHDRRYQHYRRVIRSVPARAFLRLVPMSQVESIVARMRRASVAEIERKPAGSMLVVDAAVEAELARGFDAVVCGHVHRADRRTLAGGELVTLAPWDDDRGGFATAGPDGIALHEFP